MRPSEPVHSLPKFLRALLPSVIPLCAILLMCLVLTSCVGDYCIEGIFNPGGQITENTGGCPSIKVMGNVSVSIASSAASNDGPMAPNLLHVFVTLQGIEAHPDAVAPEDSPDWQELAPDLLHQPIQVDLLAHHTGSCAANLGRAARVPAGAYGQVRLRLVPNRPAEVDPAPAENACGELGLHCAVSPDGHIHPLVFDGGATVLRVAPDRTSPGSFPVLPDMETHLTIEFEAFSSSAQPSGEAIQITPVFTEERAATCSSAAAFEP